MTNLPRLELTEHANKNNDFIIFRHALKSIKSKQHKYTTQKRGHKKKYTTTRKTSRKRKGFFNIF
jgi:hypothetical protein